MMNRNGSSFFLGCAILAKGVSLAVANSYPLSSSEMLVQAQLQRADHEIHVIAAEARRILAESHQSKFEDSGRRLFDNVNFATLCTNNCWQSIAAETITYYNFAEANGCMMRPNDTTSSTITATTTSTITATTTEDNMCVFDTCSAAASYCSYLQHDPRSSINMTTINPQNYQVFNMTAYMEYMYASAILDNGCTKSVYQFMCNGYCSGACAADSVEERKFFCAPQNPDDDADHDAQDDSGEEDVGASMADMFNMVCLKNPATGEYCYDKIAALQRGGAFNEDTASDAFPDPCNINCSTPSALGVKTLGCCFASLVDISSRSGGMSKKDVRAATAVASKCDAPESLTVCSGTDSGLLVDTEFTKMDVSLDLSCAALAAGEDEFTRSVSKAVGLSTNGISVLTCQEGSCGSRRLMTGGAAKVELLAVTKGQHKDTMAATVQAKLNDPAQVSTILATAKQSMPTIASTTTSATTTSATTTSATTTSATTTSTPHVGGLSTSTNSAKQINLSAFVLLATASAVIGMKSQLE